MTMTHLESDLRYTVYNLTNLTTTAENELTGDLFLTPDSEPGAMSHL